ncbi:hypothetical protein A3753_05270 [Sulfitobacter sp. HI0082]|nr:hypothetical protein A3753_05270 [Sulfitobacter sp. HI0082]
MGYGPAIARETIEVWIERAGALGPLLIIVLMMVSIVASPIPSAPVALVAGAAYGHVAGAVYVAIGSELGALVAFIIARYIGRDHVERWLGDKAGFGLLGSQNLLMLTVFASRLLPFISFDAMSYAAGLSRLRCQRRSKIRPLWRSKSRPVWGERLGACGPHIASPVQGALAVRPIL